MTRSSWCSDTTVTVSSPSPPSHLSSTLSGTIAPLATGPCFAALNLARPFVPRFTQRNLAAKGDVFRSQSVASASLPSTNEPMLRAQHEASSMVRPGVESKSKVNVGAASSPTEAILGGFPTCLALAAARPPPAAPLALSTSVRTSCPVAV
eukprot:CAMPEP_0171676906 /NCGR_PEP_ID=MMETSP0990-20121206/54736_1 /TAXON_ID=483369 /ORGANISM="non described non described, Strain CCMP2098" /LENGTH=150 /DNA_ID=CAMNT_0012263221 /DNA_START=34 /DNA_END=483 /DNA_ORIENTATION=+